MKQLKDDMKKLINWVMAHKVITIGIVAIVLALTKEYRDER